MAFLQIEHLNKLMIFDNAPHVLDNFSINIYKVLWKLKVFIAHGKEKFLKV